MERSGTKGEKNDIRRERERDREREREREREIMSKREREKRLDHKINFQS
jgi:hypothetical protein